MSQFQFGHNQAVCSEDSGNFVFRLGTFQSQIYHNLAQSDPLVNCKTPRDGWRCVPSKGLADRLIGTRNESNCLNPIGRSSPDTSVPHRLPAPPPRRRLHGPKMTNSQMADTLSWEGSFTKLNCHFCRE